MGKLAQLPGLLPGSASLTEVQPTDGARWLPPSGWLPATDFLFRPREPDSDRYPAVVTRYDDVLAMMLDRTGIWRREIPLSVIPEDERHCVVDASWLLDGELHRKLRGQLAAINHGSKPQAREFTYNLTKLLLTRLLKEKGPPWNLATVIDEVSLRVIIEQTLKAPPLLPHIVRLRELTRLRAPSREDDGTDIFAYFTTVRQRELEKILGTVADRYADLPSGGLARHLVDLTETAHPGTGEPQLTRKQLVSQLGMLYISYESQSATTASLVGMLLESGLFEEARQRADDAEAIRRLVKEGGRRGLSFPFNLLTPSIPVTIGGRTVPADEPVAISYAAANMDELRFGAGADRFDPRPRRPPHLGFGEGMHRCLGEKGAEQFMADVLRAMFDVLPPGVRLADGLVLREVASLSWAIASLPAVPPAVSQLRRRP